VFIAGAVNGVDIMNDNGKYISVSEAAELAGVSRVCVYKHLQRGNLTFVNVNKHGKKIKQLKKLDVIEFFHGGSKQFVNDNKPVNNEFTNVNKRLLTDNKPVNNPQITLEDINNQVKKAVIETIEEQKSQLMKPLQEQALYIAGKYEAENKFLKARLETLIEENEDLRTQIKVLPGPVEKITKQLQEYAQTIDEIQKEKEEQKNEMEVQQEQALKEQEIRLKAEAEEQMKQLSEAWKKELEQARRPWWKFW